MFRTAVGDPMVIQSSLDRQEDLVRKIRVLCKETSNERQIGQFAILARAVKDAGIPERCAFIDRAFHGFKGLVVGSLASSRGEP
jgi:hypothetical protein